MNYWSNQSARKRLRDDLLSQMNDEVWDPTVVKLAYEIHDSLYINVRDRMDGVQLPISDELFCSLIWSLEKRHPTKQQNEH